MADAIMQSEKSCNPINFFVLIIIFFYKEFQPIMSALNDSFLPSDQDINQIFFVSAKIKSQISYSTIKNFTS